MVCPSTTVSCPVGLEELWINMDRWSFGGNRLQIKAETHVLADVQTQLEAVGKAVSGAEISPKLKAKQDLLSLLIANEQMRLTVWLFPLDNKKHRFSSGSQSNTLSDVSTVYFCITISCADEGEGCCNCVLENGLVREPGHRRPSHQAFPVSTPGHGGPLAGLELSPQGLGCPRRARDSTWRSVT